MHLKVQDLTCVRGGRTVFSRLSFDLGAGQGLLLEGPNGAGKSSLLRLIAGLLAPAGGAVVLEGVQGDRPLPEFCHYLGHLNGVKRALSVAENARFWIDYLEGSAPVAEVLDGVGLGSLANMPAGLLSAGQSRRLGLARLLGAERPVWLLDEPSVSLDRDGRETLERLTAAHIENDGLLVAASHVGLGAAFTRSLVLGGPAP